MLNQKPETLRNESTEQLIKRLADLLPPQGPITAFAFLNPLQGMEHEPFLDALRKVHDLYGCEPFLQEAEYRRKLVQGRITGNDLKEIIEEDMSTQGGSQVAGLLPLADLRFCMLQHSINPGTENELRWELGETNAITRFRPEVSLSDCERLIQSTRDWVNDNFELAEAGQPTIAREELQSTAQRAVASYRVNLSKARNDQAWEAVCLSLLWRIACRRMQSTTRRAPPPPRYMRHRDLLLQATSEDSDSLVHSVLGRFTAAYLDQGYAHWDLPRRDAGFFTAFLSLIGAGGHFVNRWMRPVGVEARQLLRDNVSSLDSVEQSLAALGIDENEKEPFLSRCLIAQRGWAGMIWQTETRPDRVYVSSPNGTLVDYLAVRLLLERHALSSIASERLRFKGPLDKLCQFLRIPLPQGEPAQSVEQRAYPILQLAQLHGWSPRLLAELSVDQWNELVVAIENFDCFERRRVFHLAFERQLVHRALDAVSIRAALPKAAPELPKLQVFTCIDAREESFRRHIEEVAPDVETFGNAGFFNVPMYFRGAAEAHFAALCPIVIKPKNWVVEDVVLSLADSDRQRATARRWLGSATHSFNTGTRGSITGAILTAALGPLFTAPLVGRIIFPRLTAKMHRTARGLMAPPPVTRLRLERDPNVPASSEEEGIGFTFDEMIAMGERALRDPGLTKTFARLVIILGHGSHCLNNPHESAYHCGACSGNPGAPNARALAAILNDRRVRTELATRGIVIPETTQFLGGLHNTATESIQYFDLELLPTSHVRDLKYAMEVFNRVAERNAHERCRRFETAPLDLTLSESLSHVKDRSEDLAQTRPEYGNSTNAICFVGRRSRIRGLYLDRRSFLMSYDAAQDTKESSILARILSAVIPVCEGINLLYTLSAIDNRGWGSGTKLPHNITSLLGVMEGTSSDLRPGLPWQGVDIHEPVRLLFIIESTPDALLKIMSNDANVGRICRNEWAQLAVLDPHSNRIQRFVNGKFIDYTPLEREIKSVESSLDWYRGHRENLPFAIVDGDSNSGNQ